MYLGSNSISLSMTLYTFCMLFPFRGGSISNEKAVLLLLLIRSITFMLLFVFRVTNVRKKTVKFVTLLCLFEYCPEYHVVLLFMEKRNLPVLPDGKNVEKYNIPPLKCDLL